MSFFALFLICKLVQKLFLPYTCDIKKITEKIVEIVLFTLVAAILYFFSDWLLRLLEQKSGVPFKHRNIIFFIIFLSSSLIFFELLQRFLANGSG